MNTSTSAPAPERILQRLDWQVIRRLDGLLQGDYRSLFYGYGVDFADLREYQPGDDVRYIDWNVTARMDTPYVRQYVEDREITAWFLLDLSPSMDFGSVQSLKRTVLVDFVATLARLAHPARQSSGCDLLWRRVDRTIPARGGRIQVLRLINDLLNQDRTSTASDRPITDLGPLLGGLERDQPAVAGLCHVGLHQRPRLGAPVEPPEQAARGSRGAPVGSTRNRAARHRPHDHRGRRNGRAPVC